MMHQPFVVIVVRRGEVGLSKGQNWRNLVTFCLLLPLVLAYCSILFTTANHELKNQQWERGQATEGLETRLLERPNTASIIYLKHLHAFNKKQSSRRSTTVFFFLIHNGTVLDINVFPLFADKIFLYPVPFCASQTQKKNSLRTIY